MPSRNIKKTRETAIPFRTVVRKLSGTLSALVLIACTPVEPEAPTVRETVYPVTPEPVSTYRPPRRIRPVDGACVHMIDGREFYCRRLECDERQKAMAAAKAELADETLHWKRRNELRWSLAGDYMFVKEYCAELPEHHRR